jgi:hypothetical protein
MLQLKLLRSTVLSNFVSTTPTKSFNSILINICSK